jgi:hypothetical protein
MSAKTGVARTQRTAFRRAEQTKLGDDDLVARADLKGRKGQMKAGGAGTDGHGVRGVDLPGEFGLEAAHLVPLGDPARANHGGDGPDLFLVEGGARMGNNMH